MAFLAAEIVLEGATLAFDKLYTYAIPSELKGSLQPGQRVLVPFGRGNTKKQGMVFSIKESDSENAKEILLAIDKSPILSKEMLSLCEFMKEATFCTYYDAVKAMLPTGLGFRLVNFYSANEEFSKELLSESERQVYDYLLEKGEKQEESLRSELGIDTELLKRLASKEALLVSCDARRKTGDSTQKWIKLSSEDTSCLKLTPKQREVVELLQSVGMASVKETCYFTGVSQGVVEGLIKKGVITSFSKRIFRNPFSQVAADKSELVLTEEQRSASEGIKNLYRDSKGAACLLYGVTGSGKTKVFLDLVDTVSSEGKGVIVMVPEISLTPQLISIFTARYGGKIAVLHSAMSLGQRMDQWQKIKEGKATIAIGTRSAVFAPFENLGLIIIDEEQEHTYKSEKSPRFHTRSIAKFRALQHKAVCVLASATPSVETFSAAEKGRLPVFRLTKRYGNALLPQVSVVDMRQELQRGNSGIISSELYEGMRQELKEKRQVILLLNRRGYNTYVSCATCGEVESCPNCSVSLTYHSANDRLMCHYCGYSKKAERVCKKCGSEHIKFSGLGTQKAEQEIKALFPEARVLRLDADSTMTRDSYSAYLTDFANGEYDILLGTQMVAKGLDFPNVSLVGVLGADSAMYSEDFRSFERTFSLLTQVIGRAGRGDILGRAIIQTSSTDNEIIELARNQDYDSFYKQEILSRKLMVYPPYCDICLVSAAASSQELALKTINQVFESIKEKLKGEYSDVKIIILGPNAAAVPRVNNKYRFRMIIKCKNNKRFRDFLRSALEVKIQADATLWVDMNPESIM